MSFAPYIEQRINPVIKSPAVVSTLVQETRFSSRVSGHTYRLRDCAFRGLEWYFGTRESGRAAGVQVEFLEKPKIRPTGRMDFGPWIVHVPVDALTKNTYADAKHQCYFFGIPLPWISVTKFYN